MMQGRTPILTWAACRVGRLKGPKATCANTTSICCRYCSHPDEAIPGHYVQLVYANKSPSMIKSIFGNGARVEGWAVYSEEMMLDNGYGEFGHSPKMMLMWV